MKRLKDFIAVLYGAVVGAFLLYLVCYALYDIYMILSGWRI